LIWQILGVIGVRLKIEPKTAMNTAGLRWVQALGFLWAAKFPGCTPENKVKQRSFGHKCWVHGLLTDRHHIFWKGIWNLFTFNSLSKHFFSSSKHSSFRLSLQMARKTYVAWHSVGLSLMLLTYQLFHIPIC
jgi:hypothetical protein